MSASNDRKNEQEHFYFRLFRRLLPDFPQGEIEKGESPDFLVATPNGPIGIELTSIVDKEGRNREERRARAVDAGEAEYVRRGGPDAYVNFFWLHDDADSLPEGERIESMGQRFAGLVETHVPRTEDGHVELEWRELRKVGLDSVLSAVTIHRFPGEPTMWISQLGSTYASPRTELVRGLVAKKEKKLLKYRKCSQAWLLLVSEGIRISQVVQTKALAREVQESSFDRIYLLDVLDRVVYPIPVRRPAA